MKNYFFLKFAICSVLLFIYYTHLLGFRNGHWFDKLRREWQMYMTYKAALYLHAPELVFVLGDLTDEGYFCSPEEFDYHAKRFYKLFPMSKHTKVYVVAGNHDIGFHYSVTPYKNERFIKAFNASGVQLITERGNHFLMINSMALEGDGCSFCQTVERELLKIEKLLKCYNDSNVCPPNIKREKYSKPILMQHFPLYRHSDKACNEPDEAPVPLKNRVFKEKWDCLSKEATYQLIKQIKPRLVLSGHTHHGCTRPLPTNDGIEITFPSFSWRNKNNPSYGLFVVSPENYAFSKCMMPVESTVINIYIVGSSAIIMWCVYKYYRHKREMKYKYV
ncbi:metallophosphoesterase 1 isoform X2 [Agrilus planipennis]|uniref:Metallophosphoesterase 1 isoform X2 n=1 Tax=Agrilus planipennis TaxID=224129 RepID=A0A1W4WX61_AGRPL|nr:metallophosphoesterase 1 isoform X2 [Agrilus planipennis]